MEKTEIRRREDEAIERHGWAIRGVFGSEDGSDPELAFTVGLHERGCPEIITLGMPYQVAGRLLNEVAEQLLAEHSGGSWLAVGQRLLPGWPVKLFGVPCQKHDLIGDAEAVLARSGGTAEVVQLCWSDSKGKFPWEAGFDSTLKESQPVMGRLPGGLH